MKFRFDSAHLAALAGSGFGYVLAHYDQILSAACALAGLAYTLWQWRRKARRDEAMSPVRPLKP